MRATSLPCPAAVLSALTAVFVVSATPSSAATLEVGPNKPYARPCAAIAAAAAGDVIEVDAGGHYDGDTCAWVTDNLTVRGVNGRARIDLTNVTPAQQKGIFTIAAPNATIEHFELSGAAISAAAGNNGAGIRHQGTNLVVRDCYIHDNQDGVLGSPPTDGTGSVTIEDSELANNGAGDGYSHNLYLGHYALFTLRASYSHGARVGHLVKSRAYESDILYNRITDESGTTASYEIDLPNGGLAFLIGNSIEQSAASQNPSIVKFAEEGATNPDQHLYFVNNTVVNDLSRGTFVDTAVSTPPALLVDNLFVGPGTVVSQPGATLATNWVAATSGDPRLSNPATYDYRLAAGSPCIDAGGDPGSGSGRPLEPTAQYLHPTSETPRFVLGAAIDIGAFEFGDPPPDAGAGDAAAAGSDGGTNGGSDGGGGGGTDGASGAPDAGARADLAAAVGDGTAAGAGGSAGGCSLSRRAAGLTGATPGSLLLASLLVTRRRAAARARRGCRRSP